MEKHGQEHRSRIRRWCKYSILWTSIMGSMSVYFIFGSWSFSWNESLICDFALKLMLLREDKWGTRLPSVLSWLHVLTGFKCSRERIFLSMTPGSYIKEQKKWETDLPVRLLELAIKVFCPLTADPLELPEKCFSAACAAGRRRSDPYIEDIARSSFNFPYMLPGISYSISYTRIYAFCAKQIVW